MAVDGLRLVLIGAGAVGSLLASALAANRRSFSWVVRNPARREQLAGGLSLAVNTEGAVDNLSLPLADVELLSALPDGWEMGWLILAVKAQQVAPLLASLPQFDPTRIMVVANGLHAGQYQLGILRGGAFIDETGRLLTASTNELYLGRLDRNGTPSLPAPLLDSLTSGWLKAIADPEIAHRMWIKLALNCVVNPLTALLDVPNGELLAWIGSPLVRGLLGELAAVAPPVPGKPPLTAELLEAELRQLIEATAGNSSSMRQDVRQGRATEVAAINLAVVDYARQNNLPCPLTEALGQAVARLAPRG